MDQQKSRRGKWAWRRGLWAEWFGIIFLWCKGFRIYRHRLRTPFGEVDILARKGNTLVLVEVKLRLSHEDLPYAVSMTQQRRLERAAQYLTQSFPSHFSIRFDVLLVNPWRFPVHIKNAWCVRE